MSEASTEAAGAESGAGRPLRREEAAPEPRRGAGRGLVLLPTYNEVETLGAVISRIVEQEPRLDVLVIDDASPDGTGDLADRLAAEHEQVDVLHREGKLGLGSAYITGFRAALERGYDYVFEMDADLSHDPKHLPELLAAAEKAYDVVAGSRYLRGVNVINWPMGRLLLSWFANKYARWITGLPVTDATSGFKCFRREVLESIDLAAVGSTGYAFQIEMSFRAWKAGFRVGEIPIVFVDRDVGHSKMSGAIVREAIWRVWALRLKSLFGRL